jgi:hypothetical protein
MGLHPSHIINYYYSLQSTVEPDTTPDGKQAFLIIGDSIAAGTGETLGPETETNTLFCWNGTSIDEITDTDISTNPGGTDGTMWKQFAIDHKANTGYASVVYNAGRSGSEIWKDATTINWSVDGDLYAPMVVSANNLLTFLNVQRFAGIHIIGGINDARGGEDIEDIRDAFDSLIERLTTDFPNTPILISQIGRTESTIYNVKLYQIRNKIVDLCIDNSHVNLVGNLMVFCPNGINGTHGGFRDDDDLHPTQASNNTHGSCFARWYKNSAYSKWGRSVMSSMPDEISDARKILIDNCISGLVSDGTYFGLEFMFVFKSTTDINRHLDWSFMTLYSNVGSVTFHENDSIETTGGNDALDVRWRNDISVGTKATQTDFFVVGKIKQNNVPQGTTATFFGMSSSSNSSVLSIAQTTTPAVVFLAGDSTATTTGETKLADNSQYGYARNGGNKYHIKSGVVSSPVSQASLGLTNRNMNFGRFNNGTGTNYLNGTFEYLVGGRFSDANISQLHARVETLLTNW